MDLLATRTVVSLIGDAGKLALNAPIDAGHLRLFLEVEHAMKNGMAQWQIDRLARGKNAFQFCMKRGPFAVTPEIVAHEEPAVEQVAPQDGHLFLREGQPARLDDVNERIIEQLRVRQFQHLAVRVDLDRRDLLQAKRKIQVAVWKINGPAHR